MTAACTGATIKYTAAVPDDGYLVRVEDNGPEELKVKFERTGEEEGETEVSGECEDGVPQLRGEVSGDH